MTVVSARALAAGLVEAAGGRERLQDDPRALAEAAVDGLVPRWVARPAALERVAALLALAAEERLAVVPRGSGSALDVGHPPERLDLVLDLRDLAGVLEDHPEDLTVTVQAGITGGALAARLNARRQWLPVDPPGWRSRTLGGMTATGASGPLRARYGTLRDLLLGVRFVQADGMVTWGGARVVKSVTGYDVPKLMVGALGTLGVLGELTLRLHPMPEVEESWLALFSSAGAAEAFVAQLLDSTIQPTRVEFLNEPGLRACQAAPATAGVAVALGSVREAVREQGERVVALAGLAGGAAAPAAAGFWDRHDAALDRAEGEVAIVIGTLPGLLADTVEAVRRTLEAVSAHRTAIVSGCALLGTLRVMPTGTDIEDVRRFVGDLREFTATFGGTVMVQGGPAELRAGLDPWGPVEPAALDLMRGLKDTFDPGRVLNPGRFVGGL